MWQGDLSLMTGRCERLIPPPGRLVGVLGVVTKLGPISPVSRAVDDLGLVCSALVLGIGLVHRARRLRRSSDAPPVDDPTRDAGKRL